MMFKRTQQLVARSAFDNDVLWGSTTSYRALLSQLTKFHRSIIVINASVFWQRVRMRALNSESQSEYSLFST